MKKSYLNLALTGLAAMLIAGCANQSSYHTTSAEPAVTPAPAPAPAPAPKPDVNCSSAIKSGIVQLGKKVPAEVQLGKEYVAELSAAATSCAENVVITDHVPAGASFVRSEPAAQVDGDKLTWTVKDMDAGATQTIKVWLRADKEGKLVSCATVKADPKVCGEVRVVKADIQLTKTEPANVTVCDPIPVTLVVKNNGSSALTGVKITDTLPAGLSSEGKGTLTFDAGSLAPGESKEFKFNAAAAKVGNYVNNASVTSDQGVTAKASASTAVHQAVLALNCKAREQQYMGRNFDVCYTVSNTGDAPSAGSQVVVTVPAGLTFKSATAGGHVVGSTVVWDLGTLNANAPQDLCATFASAASGDFAFNAVAKGNCAAQVSSSCSTRIVGIAAILLEKADDPDPVAIGESTTYTVKVTNQGSANDGNVLMVVDIAPELTPVSATDGGKIEGNRVTFPKVSVLAPKAAVSYKIVAKGAKVGDGRTKFTLTSDILKSPVLAEESTTVY
ncbi:MAG: OmcB family cysteine-rich outer membrane protein [Verrucomicrobiota bacterium]